MKYLGVDPGDERIGLSISDDQGLLARPFSILKHISRKINARQIAEIADHEHCETIVVGIPYDSDGGIGPRARVSFKFIEALSLDTKLPVLPWDESGTSQAADQLLIQTSASKKSRKEHKDDLAAMLILQDFLENQAGVVNEGKR